MSGTVLKCGLKTDTLPLLSAYIPGAKAGQITISNIDEVGKCSPSMEIWDKEQIFAGHRLIYHTAILLITILLILNIINILL